MQKKQIQQQQSNKKYEDLNDTSFIDKMISETTDPELIDKSKNKKEIVSFIKDIINNET